MEDRGQLKDTFAHIEADTDEMDRFRGALSQRLEKRARWGQWWIIPPLLTIAALAYFVLFPAGKINLTGKTPDDLIALLESGQYQKETLQRLAWSSAQGEGTEEQRSGNILLCLMLPLDVAMGRATTALKTETWPEARAFYLEWIIDNADGYRFDADQIEDLMDREEDHLCVYLLEQWLKMA